MTNEEKTIAAILPLYTETDDSTYLFYTNGTTKNSNRRLRSVLAQLTAREGLSPALLRAKLGRRLTVPLPINEKLLLLPIKIRRPLVKGDSTLGYVNYYAIDNIISADSKQSLVKLHSGREIRSLWSFATLQRRFNEARLLSYGERQDDEMQLAAKKLLEVFRYLLALK